MDGLAERMSRLGIREKDLVETFIHGSGPGGQKINKTASCVSLKHTPSGEEVQCQESRSREANRQLARLRLCERLEEKKRKEQQRIAREQARKRYAKRKESATQKAKRVENKRLLSEKKRLRKNVRRNDW